MQSLGWGFILEVSVLEFVSLIHCIVVSHVTIYIHNSVPDLLFLQSLVVKKVHVGTGQEKAQSERNSHSKNRDGKN